MNHRKFILFIFVYVFSEAVFGRQSPDMIYLDKRNEAIRKAEGGMTAGEAEAELNGHLKSMIKNAIGPFYIKGFPEEWEYTIYSLNRDDLVLDGMQATSLDGKTKAIVSTVPLVRAWLQSQNYVFQSNNIKSVFKTGRFYTNVFMATEDAYAYKYSEIPIPTSSPNIAAGAILLTYSSDYVGAGSPEKIGLTMIDGDLVYVIIDEIRLPMKTIPVCKTVFEQEVRSGGGEVNYHDPQHGGQYTWIARDEVAKRASAKFLQCFKRHVSSQKYYPMLVKQAQAWITKIGNKQKSTPPVVNSPHPIR